MGEALDHFIGDCGNHHSWGLGHLVEPLGIVALGFEGVETFLQCRIGDVRDTILDGGVEPLNFLVCLPDGGMQRLLPGGTVVLVGGILGQQSLEDHAQPLLGQQSRGEMFHDQRIKQVHADAASLAGGLSQPGLGGAGIVAVTAIFAGAQRHAALTGGADGQAGEQAWAVDDTRCRFTRRVML